MNASTTEAATTTKNRWLICAGGILVQLAIGGVYAWSVFAKALQNSESAFGISKVMASVPFQVAIGMIFVGAFLGGKIQDQRGPRTVALTGVVIYAIGIILSSFARSADQMWLLILGYGVLSGVGLGLAYIVPIAMLQKWFPDKPGLVTGLAVAGFGFGAVITSPVAQSLISGSAANTEAPTRVFLPLGIAYLVAGLLGAATFANPPQGYTPAGWTRPTPATSASGAAQTSSRDFTQAEALRTPQWYLLTAILCLAVLTGIALISVAAGSATDIAGMSAGAAASFVGIMGLFNGAGRILWASVSDKIGKMNAFKGILALTGLCLLAIPHASSPILFVTLAAIIYLCYGGAFGTMPSTAGSFFGVTNAGAIYGLMLVAWSIGGVFGPLLVSALIGSEGNYTLAYTTLGVIALAALVLPFITRKPQAPSA